MIPFTLHHYTSPFPFNFVSVKASNSNLLSLKTSNTSSFFAVPFIPLIFHVNSQFTWFHQVIEGGIQQSLPPHPRLDDVLKGKKKQGADPTQHPQTIWSTPMTPMDYTVNLFCSQFTRNKIEQRRCESTMNVML